jgi:hypothetical protein
MTHLRSYVEFFGVPTNIVVKYFALLAQHVISGLDSEILHDSAQATTKRFQ